ncbi:MAG: hypothetical protein GX328_00685 [Clostridiaceae bacterium]|nr:hypothetical protein [Clostridiaceae bacterium]
MQEGMCKNCGSLVYVDPKHENCHCLFCDCVFPAKEALEIVKHPQDYEFLNEEQPEYKGEAINPQQTKVNANLDQLIERREKKSKAASKPKPKYAIEKKEIPDVNLSKKQILTIIGIVLAVVAIFLVITLPQTVTRDQHRANITDEFKKALNDETYNDLIDYDQGFAIYRMNNTHADLIVEAELSKEDARDIFASYCEARANVHNIDLEDMNKVYADVSFRISMPGNGGYLIRDKNLADLDNLELIEVLP